MTKDNEPGAPASRQAGLNNAQEHGFRQNLIRESFDKLSWQVSGLSNVQVVS